jgi:hypothetical protein
MQRSMRCLQPFPLSDMKHTQRFEALQGYDTIRLHRPTNIFCAIHI